MQQRQDNDADHTAAATHPRRRSEWTCLLLRCAWALLIALSMNAVLFDGQNFLFVVLLSTALCSVYVLESLHRTWRLRQTRRRRKR